MPENPHENDDGTLALPPEAVEIGNVAFRAARDAGCNCEPHVVVQPTLAPPFWNAVIEHDEWCLLLQRIRADRS